MIVATANAIKLPISIGLYNLDGSPQIDKHGNEVVFHFDPETRINNIDSLMLGNLGNMHFVYSCYNDEDISSGPSSADPSPTLSPCVYEVNATVLAGDSAGITPITAFLA